MGAITRAFANSIQTGGAVSIIADDSIVNADINTSAAIDATKIHDGSVSNTEFGYIGGLTSDAQTQISANTSAISAKATKGEAIAMSMIFG